MPKRVEARPFFRPAAEEQRYLPECPRVRGRSLLWISIQYAADRPRAASTCWTWQVAKTSTTRCRDVPDFRRNRRNRRP
jgi:hypothetical protein